MKTITLTDLEHNLLLKFLEELSDKYSNAGCNDYELPYSEEAAKIVKSFTEPEMHKFICEDSTIYTMDILVLEYIMNVLQK